MQTHDKGRLIVISGPSGTGKGTVIGRLRELRGDVCLSVSVTTRAPRPGEVNGRDYFFVTREEFSQKVAEGALLEHAEFVGNCYGTPREYVERKLDQGVSVILEIDVQGAEQVARSCPDAVSIFILPPSMEELERRLRGRGTESDGVIRERLDQAARELRHVEDYRYAVINSDFHKAAEEIRDILVAEEHKVHNMTEQINEVLNRC